MSDARLLEIAHRLDILNERMSVCLDQWETPELTKQMNDIIEEYDALFAEYEALGGA